MLESLIQILRSHPDVADWTVRSRPTTSDQIYLNGPREECRRTVRSRPVTATVLCPVDGPEGPLLGSASFGSFEEDPHQEEHLALAVEMARSAGNPPYQPVIPPQEYPCNREADPDCAHPWELLPDLADRFHRESLRHQGISLASLEIFLDRTEERLVTSRGLDLTQDATRIYVEMILFHTDQGGATEFHTEQRFTALRHLDVPALVARYATYVRDRHHGIPPETGSFPVVMSGETLPELWRYFTYHSNAAAMYSGTALFRPGEPVLDGVGDRLTLESAPGLAGGLHSANFDHDGLPLHTFPILKAGVLAQPWAAKRHADYLSIPPTGPLTNLVVAPGNTPYEELIQRDGPVYVIESISSWEPNAITGDYSGEIRLGYRVEKDRVVPIRGGSVNGNVIEGFRDCRLSRETLLTEGYHGPRGVRLPPVSFAGS